MSRLKMFKKTVWLIDCDEETDESIILAVYSTTYRFFKPLNKVCYSCALDAWESAVKEVKSVGAGTVYADSADVPFDTFRLFYKD